MRNVSINAIGQPSSRPARARYVAWLDWSFTLFSTLRLLTYIPTMWAIHQSGSSSQHSLLTWLVWTAANSVMAASLLERSAGALNKLIVVNAANATQCLVMSLFVAWYR